MRIRVSALDWEFFAEVGPFRGRLLGHTPTSSSHSNRRIDAVEGI